LGVAGFRVDAVPFILEEAPRSSRKPVIHFEYLKEFREFLQWRVGDAVLLGEANVPPDQTLPYFADGDGLHLMFNFWVNQHLFLSLATGDARPVAAALDATRHVRHAPARRRAAADAQATARRAVGSLSAQSRRPPPRPSRRTRSPDG